MELSFLQDRETKHAVRYEEQHPETEHKVVGTLYVSKHAVARLGNPRKLRVTVEADGE